MAACAYLLQRSTLLVRAEEAVTQAVVFDMAVNATAAVRRFGESDRQVQCVVATPLGALGPIGSTSPLWRLG